MYSVEKPSIKYRKDYQPSQYLIKQTQLRFQLFEEYTFVYAELQCERNPLDQNLQLLPLVLNGVELELQEIFVDDKKLTDEDDQWNSEHLTIFNTNSNCSLRTKVIIQPQNNKSLEGFNFSKKELFFNIFI